MKLTVNGKAYEVDVPDSMPLLWVLRDVIGLTGTKFGCGVAQCGACTVHVGGRPSALLPDAHGHPQRRGVVTIEGLHPKGEHPLQVAWRESEVPQCGYCQPGQIMQAAGLLENDPQAHRRGHRCGDERPHLPLRHLLAHQGRHQDRRGEAVMRAVDRDRRALLKLLGTGGLVLAVGPGGIVRLGAEGPEAGVADAPWAPHVYVRVGEDGLVTILCHRSEMGQGIRTTMPMIIADEMEADWARCRVEQADGDARSTARRTRTAPPASATSSRSTAKQAPRFAHFSRTRPRRNGASARMR